MESSGEERNARLRDAIGKLRVRGDGRRRADRWLMIAGAALIGIGLPVILLGWWGASRTPYVFEQIPYLISGGVFGLAIAVVGGLCYFAYWMARQGQESRRQSDELQSSLRRIETLLATGVAGGSQATHGSNGFVMTPTGTMFHRPDCVVVSGRSGVKAVPEGTEAKLEPCRICDPLGDTNPREKAGQN
ncbi:MAG: hypothetical protein ABR548_03435 [Actinomycetota bacterium]|nr:hypothetical protein [Actinomycetota bacterium]